MSAHYYPAISGCDTEDLDQAHRGTWLKESSGFTANRDRVTCERCKRSKKLRTAAAKLDEREFVRQMGDMAEFMAREE